MIATSAPAPLPRDRLPVVMTAPDAFEEFFEAERDRLFRVLCLITGQATHGNAIAAQLGHDGPPGQVWHVHKAVVYRSIDRLQQAGLVVAVGEEPSSRGPVRTLVEATPKGHQRP